MENEIIKPLDILLHVDLSGISSLEHKMVLVMTGIVITGLVYSIFRRYAK